MTLDATAREAAERRSGDRSYLLRIRDQRGGVRYLVQELKTGERHEFRTEAELRRFIAELGRPGLR